MTEKPKPIHTLRLGPIQAAIWSNPGQHGPFYNVTIDRRFKDAQDQWQSSGSFGRDDLLIVAKVADAAHTYICERQASDRSAQDGNGHEPTGSPSAAPADSGKRRSR
ncbi:MAG: hypothetical protein AABZ53_13110 [Planctomycetota bacterium]